MIISPINPPAYLEQICTEILQYETALKGIRTLKMTYCHKVVEAEWLHMVV